MLLIFSGLPGTGKTTIARALAHETGALYLRIDSTEHAISRSQARRALAEVGDMGHCVAYAVAEDNLRLGRTVVADSVNPLGLTRDAWRNVAERAEVHFLDIVVICSDRAEHQRRLEARNMECRAVTWQNVLVARSSPGMRTDTAGQSVEQSLAAAQRALRSRADPAR
jgi:predicted kinase